MVERVTTASDPTDAVLSESALSVHGVCDYVVNVATGCRHGCAFCYVPSTPPVRARKDMICAESGVESPRSDWGSYVLYRDDLPERLDAHLDRKRTWHETERGRGIVGVSFSTDPYMDDRAAGIATDVIRVLADHEKYVRVLTRNPTRALRDLETFVDAGEYVTVGTSIPSLNAEAVRALEPHAPAPASRLDALRSFAEAGVQVYALASPTYPDQDRAALRRLLERIATVDPAVVFHEPFNVRSARMSATRSHARDCGDRDLADAFDRLSGTDAWIEYALEHSRQVLELGADLSLPIHLCPHWQLTRAADGAVRKWFEAWRERQPPESFAGRPLSDDAPLSTPDFERR
ncbi:SPL family radical SAM protein [Halapricum salinum]|uniref:Radical SAM protein n=1 Tax=Halapricum salinum TaxID=1457250 RepID=A0A4D6HDW7_9EURY|nr:radical SAM protein [Halapricum salinum]QCC52000.1 radical SAM protein [Halapricum salinum]